MSEKPVIFISHSSSDNELARLLKQQIELCFDNNVEAFAADINPGEDWFEKVMVKLNKADAIVVLITHYSVNISHWVWFELGYFWARHDDALQSSDAKRKIYYPLYMSGIEWPSPVKDLQIQAALLNDRRGLLKFFNQLTYQFEGGNTDKANLDTVIELVNSYPTKFLPPSDPDFLKALNENYLQPQHSDQYYLEVIDDFIHSEWLNFAQYAYQYLNREQHYGWAIVQKIEDIFSNPQVRDYSNLLNLRLTVFTGKLINYLDLDSQLHLPSGTSKRLLRDVAKRYCLIPTEDKNFDDSVRFQVEIKTNKQ